MPEPHDFFFSYSRRDYENAGIYLTTFLEDLSKEIRRRASLAALRKPPKPRAPKQPKPETPNV